MVEGADEDGEEGCAEVEHLGVVGCDGGVEG